MNSSLKEASLHAWLGYEENAEDGFMLELVYLYDTDKVRKKCHGLLAYTYTHTHVCRDNNNNNLVLLANLLIQSAACGAR